MAFIMVGGVPQLRSSTSPAKDVAVATAELKRRGVEFAYEPHRITEQPAYDLWMSFFKDPDGRLLALSMQAPKGWKPA